MQISLEVLPVSLLIQLVIGQEKPIAELRNISSVDLKRYSGTWYEIGRLPNSFQRDCAGEVTATYTLDGNEIEVLNRCRKADASTMEAKGRARRAYDELPNTKLKVRFAPAVLSFLPFVWRDYWIIDLAADYAHAAIGEPNRKYLWVLSRTKKLCDAIFNEILDRVRQQAYDTGKITMTRQTLKTAR